MNKDYKKIAETTLKILDKKPWHDITLKEIQTKSKVKKFNLLIKNKKDLLIKLNNYFDYKVSSKILRSPLAPIFCLIHLSTIASILSFLNSRSTPSNLNKA